MYHKGNIIAQSYIYIYRSGDTIVLDSIETRSSIRTSVIANLVLKAGKAMLGRLGVTTVNVGKTTYGVTSEVCAHLDGVSCDAVKNRDSIYTDAKKQWRLCEL